jgi:hypothetical protein
VKFWGDIARPSADELISNKSRIAKRLIDLNEETEAILQLLAKMSDRPSLSMEKLDAAERADFLRLMPAESRADIEKKGAIDMRIVLEIYKAIKFDVQHDASSLIRLSLTSHKAQILLLLTM